MAISAPETRQLHPPVPQQASATTKLEVESVKCYCCNFSEDCTPAYISRVRDRFQGRWLCGLCVEAVQDEVIRSDTYISTEEALSRHVSFCKKFRSSSPLSQTEHPIFVMSKILRRSLDSPTAVRSNSSSALPDVDKISGSSLVRSESCFSALSR